MLMATPAIRWLAQRYPDARLDVLTGPYGKTVLEENPEINDLIVYNKNGSALGKLKVILQLWRRYDLAILLESSSRYVFLSWFIRAKCRIGISRKVNRLLHSHYEWNHGIHTVRNNLGVLAPLLEDGEVPSTDMALSLADKDTASAARFLEAQGIRPTDRVVFIQPACGPNELLRPWPAEHVAALVDLTVDKLGARVILNAGPREWESLDRVARLAVNEIVVNDTDIRTTAALIAASGAVVTPDTGTLHMAAALGVPVVALFGPSSPENYGPMGSGGHAVLQQPFECSPCVFAPASPARAKCLAQRKADCMQAIAVEDVFDRLASLVQKTNVSNQ
jgi:ADP-heptose:LPS heptosyltransferase